jgi:ATP-dependent Lon protease
MIYKTITKHLVSRPAGGYLERCLLILSSSFRGRARASTTRSGRGLAEQNLYARAGQLVGDKDPRHHEFTVQLRAFDASKSGAKLGMGSLIALSTALLKKSARGGLIIVGEINLGGSIEPIHNPVPIAEIAVEKGATALLMPVACRRQLMDLSDDMATKIDIQFYADARDALLKAIVE